MSEHNNESLERKLKELETRYSKLEAMSSVNDSDEIDLRELWNAIWEGKWFVLSITFILSVSSLLYALSLPNIYKSTVILAPASSSSSGQLSKLAGQFGGLASLAGINLDGGGVDNKSMIGLEVLKTWGFLEKFIEQHNIEKEIFAATDWNRLSNKLSFDEDIYDPTSNKWVREFDPRKGEAAEPSSWELYEEFSKMIKVTEDKDSGLFKLSVEHISPVLAKQWVDKLVIAINNHMRVKDEAEAKKSIAYLKKKAEETNLAQMQSVFYQLIEEQTKTLMLAEVSDEYVFKTISEAKVPEEKLSPSRALICILGFLLGVFVSVVILVVKAIFKTSES